MHTQLIQNGKQYLERIVPSVAQSFLNDWGHLFDMLIPVQFQPGWMLARRHARMAWY